MSNLSGFSLALVTAAVSQGFLSTHQAIQTYIAYGEALGKQAPFSLRRFWCDEKFWLAEEDFAALENSSPLPQAAAAIDGVEVSLETLGKDILKTSQIAFFPDTKKTSAQMAFLEEDRDEPPLPFQPLFRDKDFSEDRLASLPPQQARSLSGVLLKKLQTFHTRYIEEKELGRGGLGRVVALYDQDLGRRVACKFLLQGSQASRQLSNKLLEEARLTGRLEHPNIIPIYDLGLLDDGQPYYTMRLSTAQTFEEALNHRSMSLLQMIKILQQICMGLEYAHTRQIIHRDIKPSNILLGEFGEVLILDWGIAEKLVAPPTPPTSAPASPLQGRNAKAPAAPDLVGTPAYLAPEILAGQPPTPAVDQYALGVILYEMLTGHLPFQTPNFFTLLFSVISERPLPPRQCNLTWDIPEELEQICLRMLEKDPAARFPSCRAVCDRLDEYLEGNREKQRRHEAALARIAEADEAKKEFYEKQAAIQSLKARWKKANESIHPWDSVEDKKAVWAQEDALQDTEQTAIRLFGIAVQKYIRALEHEPGQAQAKRGLVEMYWSRFLKAEEAGDLLQQIYYRDLVEFYDDGTYARLLHEDGSIGLTSDPPADHVYLFRYEERERRLQPLLLREALGTPLRFSVPPGSYLLLLQKAGYREIVLPVFIQRGSQQSFALRFYLSTDIGSSFLQIPAGEFLYGGDAEAPMGLPLARKTLDEFWISRFPVTLGEYCDYLNDLHALHPDRAASLIPRAGSETYVHLQNGWYQPQRSSLFEGAIAERYPPDLGYEALLPVFGVSWFEAILYCRWRSEKEGRFLTLPTEEQWEKAAGGVDHRIFPWGDRFDASFCKMGRSRSAHELQPEPVGVFAADESPYGLRDLVGSISEWTLSLPQDEVDLLTQDPKITPIMRGGGWVASNEQMLRLRMRLPRPEGSRTYNSGFRLVTNPNTKK